MARVEYNAGDYEIIGELKEGTYFIYQNQLYVRISEYETEKDVFNFNDNSTFCWSDKFDPATLVHVISPDRITIQIN